jgi:hypothetical protein
MMGLEIITKREKQGRMAEMSSSLFSSSPAGGHSQGRMTVDQIKQQRFINMYPI